eukprot:gene9731-6819_t
MSGQTKTSEIQITQTRFREKMLKEKQCVTVEAPMVILRVLLKQLELFRLDFYHLRDLSDGRCIRRTSLPFHIMLNSRHRSERTKNH